MDISGFCKRLEISGIGAAGQAHWAACLTESGKAEQDFKTAAHLEHPFGWYNPKIANFVRQMPVADETRAYIYAALLGKLLPDPDSIQTWADMRRHVQDIAEATGFIQQTDRALPANQAFLTAFAAQNTDTLEAWNLEVLYGNLWGILAAAIRQLTHAGPDFAMWQPPYLALLSRLISPSGPLGFKEPEPNGLLVLTSHCRFNVEHAKQTKLHLRQNVFIMGRHVANDPVRRNAAPMLMMKTMKAGKAVYAAIDGGFGNLNQESAVFGCKIALPGSFLWAASKTGPDCQWRYLVANLDGIGTASFVRDFTLPPLGDGYMDAFLQELGHKIEASMIEHPFSFGTYQNLRQRLLSA